MKPEIKTGKLDDGTEYVAAYAATDFGFVVGTAIKVFPSGKSVIDLGHYLMEEMVRPETAEPPLFVSLGVAWKPDSAAVVFQAPDAIRWLLRSDARIRELSLVLAKAAINAESEIYKERLAAAGIQIQ